LRRGELARHLPDGAWVGVDNSAEMLARAPRRTVRAEATALPRAPMTFDAEIAPGLLAELFDDVEVEAWDAPLLELPSTVSVRDYLVGKGVGRGEAEAYARAVTVPLSVTKRGALVFARKGVSRH
jgi:hypothetical protein